MKPIVFLLTIFVTALGVSGHTFPGHPTTETSTAGSKEGVLNVNGLEELAVSKFDNLIKYYGLAIPKTRDGSECVPIETKAILYSHISLGFTIVVDILVNRSYRCTEAGLNFSGIENLGGVVRINVTDDVNSEPVFADFTHVKIENLK